MRKYIAIFSILLFTVNAAAFDMALGVGYRMNDGDTDVANASVDGQGGLQFGGIVYADITEQLVFRSGFMYTMRKYDTKVGVSESEVDLAYVDVPATIMFKMEDYGGAFAGVNLGLKVSDDCGGGDCTDVKSTIVPLTFGGFFKIAPQVAFEVFYEMLSGEIVQGLEDTTAVGANVLFTFD